MKKRTEDTEKARELRRQGWSVGQISKELRISKGSISPWVRDIKLTDNQIKRLEDNAFKNRMRMKEWSSKMCLACLDKRLAYQDIGRQKIKDGASKEYISGIMLYWAEGAKSRTKVAFSNSDFNMVKYFVEFLEKEIGIKKEDMNLTVQTYLNGGADIDEIQDFWLKKLDMPKTCLRKPYIKEDHGSKRKKLKYGVGVIRVNDVKVIQEIYGAIQEYIGFTNPEWAE